MILASCPFEALSDVLAAEVKPFGIRVISIQAGTFRTQTVLNAAPGTSIFYPEVATAFKLYSSLAGKAPGDAEKGAARIVDVMQKEGPLPERLVFGVSWSRPFNMVNALSLVTLRTANVSFIRTWPSE